MLGELEPRVEQDGVVDLRLLGHFVDSQLVEAVANATPVDEQDPRFAPLSAEQLETNARGIALVRLALRIAKQQPPIRPDTLRLVR